MRLSHLGFTFCVQCFTLFVPISCSSQEEIRSIEITQKPDARLNSVINRFCNFLQVKTTAAPTTARTKFMMFKYGSVSTKFYVYAKPNIEERVHKAAEQLLASGFHNNYVQKYVSSGKNSTSFAMGLIKALLAGVKELLPAGFIIDS